MEIGVGDRGSGAGVLRKALLALDYMELRKRLDFVKISFQKRSLNRNTDFGD